MCGKGLKGQLKRKHKRGLDVKGARKLMTDRMGCEGKDAAAALCGKGRCGCTKRG